MAKPPSDLDQRKSDPVAAFLNKVAATPAPAPMDQARGRLIFAMDATASREPTWDRACHLQSEMFEATREVGGLDVQLVFFRGYRECKAGKFVSDAAALHQFMSKVRCLGGQTQIGRVLDHALKETAKQRVGALVVVGDAFEEDIDRVCHRAGELALKGLPAFMFHEGGDPVARRAFQQIAQLSGGAYAPFNAAASDQLKRLLGAVASFAAGGRRALADYTQRQGGGPILSLPGKR